MRLSVEQILILNALVYLDDFKNRNKSHKIINKSVYDFAMNFKFDCFWEGDLPGEISRSEFEYIINTIKRDREIFEKLVIKDIENSILGSKYSSKKNMKNMNPVVNATFVSGESKVYIVYKGTSGAMEWRDNGELGYEDITDTKQQISALEYYDKISGKIDKLTTSRNKEEIEIWISGHSKGGNKAQYIGILRGDDQRVRGVHSFDGPGFNKSFHIKYRDKIAKNSHKIISVSSDRDFVNILFKLVAGSVLYIEANTNKGESSKRDNVIIHRFGGYHSIFAMFKVKGDFVVLGDIVPQNEMVRIIHNLLWKYQKSLEKDDLKYIYYRLSSAMMDKEERKLFGEDYSNMPKGFVNRITAETREFFKGDGDRYKEVFKMYIQPILKELGVILVLGNREETTVDKIRSTVKKSVTKN